MDYYNIDGIIGEALRSNTDITPSDRKEWKLFCCACKVLGVAESSFVALSRLHGTPDNASRKAWREERHPEQYRDHDRAAGMIVNLAKQAGIEVKQFILLPQRFTKHDTPHAPTREAAQYSHGKFHITAAPIAPTSHKEAPQEPFYISDIQLTATQEKSRETALYAFLASEFEPEEVLRVFEAYRIGGSKFVTSDGFRAVSFPYIAADGRCIDCKLFHISPKDGSRKTAPPLKSWSNGSLQSSWALAEMKQNHRRAPWCNFGDHLLRERPTAPIGIVESEKTALILAIVYPQIIWTAVGSLNNLNPGRCQQYFNRKVTIYPDRDGLQAWRNKAQELAKQGFNISIDTTTERHPGSPKDDLADIVLRFRHGEQANNDQITTDQRPNNNHSTTAPEVMEIWEDMKSRTPYLAELEKTLELEPISIM